MSTRYILGNLRTGRRILDLPVLTGPWDVRLNTAGSITCSVDMNDPDVQRLDLRNTSTPTQTFLGVVEDDQIIEAGPIWTRGYNRDSRILSLGAKGLGSYFNYRLILPLLAATLGTDQWTIPDPLDATATIPNPDLTTTISGVSLGTIAKGLIEQARLWTGGDLPIVFQADEVGTRERTFLGVDFKPVLEAIEDMSKVIGGPDFVFQPRFTSDMLGVEWLFRTGTEAEPLITSQSRPVWNVTRPESPVSGLTIAEDGSKLLSLGWQVGGRQDDKVLVARAYNPALVDANFPLMEAVDSSHSSVSEQDTLDGHAESAVRLGQKAQEVWAFTAKANPRDQAGKPAGPLLSQFRVGDFAELVFDAWHPATDTEPWESGDPFLTEGGTTVHRIIGLSGDEQGVDVQVSLAPRVE